MVSSSRSKGRISGLLSVILFSLSRLSPFGVFFLSQYGYLDLVYKYTLGVPTPEKRIVYSVLLVVLAVNLIVGGWISAALRDPEEQQDSKPVAKKGERSQDEDKKDK